VVAAAVSIVGIALGIVSLVLYFTGHVSVSVLLWRIAAYGSIANGLVGLVVALKYPSFYATRIARHRRR
jgi:hypothetical protein